jgi:hypothetical protein
MWLNCGGGGVIATEPDRQGGRSTDHCWPKGASIVLSIQLETLRVSVALPLSPDLDRYAGTAPRRKHDEMPVLYRPSFSPDARLS